MLIIRLTRRGRRNDPNFRLVVAERVNPVKGKFLEELGHYNPKLKTKLLKKERILYWLSQGAKTSSTVHNLLVSEGIIQAPKVKAWRPKASSAGPREKEKTETQTSPAQEPKKEAQEVGEQSAKEAIVEELPSAQAVEENQTQELSANQENKAK